MKEEENEEEAAECVMVSTISFIEANLQHSIAASRVLTRTVVVKGIYRVSQEEWTKLRESVPYVELYRYNPKHLYQKLNGYGDNGQRSLKL